MIGQPKWNFMMSELPLSHKLKKWNKKKMKWGEEGLNGGFLMGKAKLRLIYAARSPVFPHQPIWQEKWKSNCSAFFDARPQSVIYWLKLIDVYPVFTRNMLHQRYEVQHLISPPAICFGGGWRHCDFSSSTSSLPGWSSFILTVKMYRALPLLKTLYLVLVLRLGYTAAWHCGFLKKNKLLKQFSHLHTL